MLQCPAYNYFLKYLIGENKVMAKKRADKALQFPIWSTASVMIVTDSVYTNYVCILEEG